MPRPLRVFLLFTALASSGAPAVRAADLAVFAAASLSEALREAAPDFTAATGHTLRFNFAGSGTLARQIAEGAPADLFVSADELRMDRIQEAGLLLAGTRRRLLVNTLVVIVAAGDAPRVEALADLADPALRRIALGDPATVPAGAYARQHLEARALWAPLVPKLLPMPSVRAALAAVESGDADAAFVYHTDALSSEKVRVALAVPAADGPAISYPVAVLRDARQPEAARALAAWLAGPEARVHFARRGFLPVDPVPTKP